jgi:hypothetical protein
LEDAGGAGAEADSDRKPVTESAVSLASGDGCDGLKAAVELVEKSTGLVAVYAYGGAMCLSSSWLR